MLLVCNCIFLWGLFSCRLGTFIHLQSLPSCQLHGFGYLGILWLGHLLYWTSLSPGFLLFHLALLTSAIVCMGSHQLQLWSQFWLGEWPFWPVLGISPLKHHLLVYVVVFGQPGFPLMLSYTLLSILGSPQELLVLLPGGFCDNLMKAPPCSWCLSRRWGGWVGDP